MRRSRPVNAILTPTFMVSAMAALVLAGCGGGGGGGGGLEAAITTVTGKTESGATVTIGTKTGPVTLPTDSSGNFSRPVETSTLATDTAVVVTVTKPNAETCTTTASGVSSSGGTLTITGCTTLTPLSDGSYAPAEGAVLTRLGNGVAVGEPNSKLTLTTVSGTTKTLKIGSPGDTSKPISDATFATFKTFTVSMNIRGLESDSTCGNNKITVFQAATASATPTVTKSWTTGGANPLLASPTNGDFRTDKFELSLANFPITKTGGDLFVKLDSGPCVAPSTDLADDFEFVNVLGKFAS